MGEKTKEMEVWERQEVDNCAKHFKTLERTEKTLCVALINSLQGNVATEQLKATVVSKHAENRKVMEALALVGEWQSKWLTLGAIIHMGVTTASASYDLILQVRAQKAIVFSIIDEIAISLLPELKIISTAFKAFTLDKGMYKRFGFKTAFAHRGLGADFGGGRPFDQVTELLDRRSKDITNAIRDGVSTSAKIDEASRSLEASFQAKNQIFRTMLGNTAANLVQVTNLAALINADILVFSSSDTFDLKTRVTNIMKAAGLPYDPTPISPKIWEELSNQVLYDMLRAYCKVYVSSAFEGLDRAQREMIYERFANSYKNSFIHDPRHPYINDDNELRTRWLGLPSHTGGVDYHVRPGQRR